MAWTPPRPAELRDRIRIEKRAAKGQNVGGVIRAAWIEAVSDRMGRLSPLRGGADVIADRIAGVSVWTLDVPACSAIRAIAGGVGMRVVDARDPSRVFEIQSCLDLEGRDRWRTLTLQMVGADG